MDMPPYTAVYFHPQFGPSYASLHTVQEFDAIVQWKNSRWAKLIHNETGEVVSEIDNPLALPQPIPSQEPVNEV